MWTYNEVMQLLELAGFVKCEYCESVVLSCMNKNVNEWHVLVWIFLINFNKELKYSY